MTLKVGFSTSIKDAEYVRRKLENFIEHKSKNLKLERPKHFAREIIEGLPFEITLYRMPCSLENEGDLKIQRSVDENLERLRVQRIEVALRKKLPKLKKAKANKGISILVLESNDISLSNNLLIADAVKTALTKRKDQPDNVVLIETEGKDWYMSFIKKEGKVLDIPIETKL